MQRKLTYNFGKKFILKIIKYRKSADSQEYVPISEKETTDASKISEILNEFPRMNDNLMYIKNYVYIGNNYSLLYLSFMLDKNYTEETLDFYITRLRHAINIVYERNDAVLKEERFNNKTYKTEIYLKKMIG